MEKMEIMKEIAEGVKTKCEENEIEYVLVQTAKEIGDYVSHSTITNVLLKEVVDIVKRINPIK